MAGLWDRQKNIFEEIEVWKEEEKGQLFGKRQNEVVVKSFALTKTWDPYKKLKYHTQVVGGFVVSLIACLVVHI